MEKNRYIGEYPVIGIRPIVEGRRGPMQLRESLEDQVMAMAEAAKARGVAAVHCQTAEEVLQYVRQFVRPGDAVLVKASHSMGLEQLLQEYYKELPQG